MINFLDLQQDSNGDLLVSRIANDFVIAASDNQHIADIIYSNQGEWKQYPSLGVGVINYLNSSGSTVALSRQIIIQLQGDGYNVTKPQIAFDSSGKLDIVPNATR
jgi:hypothetical protein